jgi:hypothetical protein
MMPTFIRPMLAQSMAAPFDSEDYLFEINWDGIRRLMFVEAGRARLQSRELRPALPTWKAYDEARIGHPERGAPRAAPRHQRRDPAWAKLWSW